MMKNLRDALFLFSIVILGLTVAHVVSADEGESTGWNDYTSYTVIDHDTTWSGHITRTDIPKPVVIVNDAVLTIEPGTQVEVGRLWVYSGRIVALGTETEPIHFTKRTPDYSRVPADYAPYDKECYYQPEMGMIEFSSVAYDDSEPSIFHFVQFEGMGTHEWYEAPNCPWSVSQANPVRNFFLQKVLAAGGWLSNPALKFSSGMVQIEHASFKNNHAADIETNLSFSDDQDWYDQLSITDSNFEGNTEDIAVISTIDYDGATDFSGRVLLRNNWYGDASGPETPSNPSGHGEKLIGTFNLDGWNTAKHSATCTENCFSNVMFLPGLEGSRLYDDQRSTCIDDKTDPKRVWEPNCNSDVRKLYMDSNGQSLDPDIHTKEGDVLDEVSLGFNIYKTFILRMNAMRDTDHLINDWKPIAYDWRLSFHDILADDSIENTLKDLARHSNTGKVTIIAHSNGGLLAKALMQKLGETETAKLVDRVIFVAVPQLGTPEAVAGMLNGAKQNIFPVMDTKTARGLSENMPGAYQLLPSKQYFSTVGTPAITFDISDTSDLKGRYGDPVDSAGKLHDFLMDSYRRVSATDGDTDIPSTLNGSLLRDAENIHEDLDHWVAPDGVQVVQIGGWGVPATIKGAQYSSEKKRHCDASVCAITDFLSLNDDLDFTLDGDGTVVSPSALYMGGGPERYWVDLDAYNIFLLRHVDHKDILEIPELNTFIADSITGSVKPLTEYRYLSMEAPASNDRNRLQYSLQSPLTLDLYDDLGHHTGVRPDGTIEEQIPGTYYRQFGDVKYIFADESSPMRISMSGYDTGTFTFSVKELRGDMTLGKITFKDMPTTSQTRVDFNMPSDLEHASDLRIDLENDGVIDHQVHPKIGEIVTLEEKDMIPPVTLPSLSGTQGLTDWYTSGVTLTLTATDNENGSGVQETKYSLDNGATWNVYTVPISISSEGTTTVLYFSTDKSGNREETKTQVIKIDKTAPEAKVSFNPNTQKMDIIGRDRLSAVTVTVLEKPDLSPSSHKVQKIRRWFSQWHERHRRNLPDMLATLTDEAGHVTSLSFEKSKDRNGFLFVRLQSIGYDGSETTFDTALLQYKWQMERRNVGQYRTLSAYLKGGISGLESHYIPKKNETWIMERSGILRDDESDDDSDRRPTRKKLPGMVVPYMESEQGKINIKY
jgi:pimeloyl-ACP methyl ester carboxylesterase